ncbi:MAG: hypothetical protein ACJ8GN_07025 [Longimicrobiaceae bacterium]
MDYSLLSRVEFEAERLAELPAWDIFLSAYNESERVNRVFDAVRATRKEWLIHPEYDFSPAEVPTSFPARSRLSRDEAEFWHKFFSDAGFDSLPRDARIAVDITGFMRPHLMLLPRLLRDQGFLRLHMLYSDPVAYSSGEKTPFTKGAVTEIRQVRGFEGLHEPDADGDLLVIGAGYDHELIRRVAENKRAARKLEMFGLPSLQPHMYEENRLRAAGAEEAIGPLPERAMLFAPANDPFATAQELHDRLTEEKGRGFENLYLSPLSTKPQALGFALYYLCECIGTATSIIFPFAEYYSRETSVGLARVWLYDLELDWLL